MMLMMRIVVLVIAYKIGTKYSRKKNKNTIIATDDDPAETEDVWWCDAFCFNLMLFVYAMYACGCLNWPLCQSFVYIWTDPWYLTSSSSRLFCQKPERKNLSSHDCPSACPRHTHTSWTRKNFLFISSTLYIVVIQIHTRSSFYAIYFGLFFKL